MSADADDCWYVTVNAQDEEDDAGPSIGGPTGAFAWTPPPLGGATDPRPDGRRIAPGDFTRDGVTLVHGYLLHPPAKRTKAKADAEAARVHKAIADAAGAALEAALQAAGAPPEEIPDEVRELAARTLTPPYTDDGIRATFYMFRAIAVVAHAAGSLAEAGAQALRAELGPAPLTDEEEACITAVGGYIRGSIEAVARLEEEGAARAGATGEPKKRGRSDLIAFTAPAVAALEQAVAEAVAEGRRLRAAAEAGAEPTPGVSGRSNFALTDGRRRLINTRGKAGYMVAVDFADPVASLDEVLREIGEYAGLEAVFAVAAAVYHALGRAADLDAEPGPIHAADVLLDIGWQRDYGGKRESREDAIERVARLYLRLNGWNVEGAGWGTFTTKDGAAIDASSRGPLFTTTVIDDPQGTLTGERRPVGFVFKPGEYLERAAAYPQLLPAFGTYRELARMPRQRPADAWAVAIGLALVQRWRELASHSKVTKPGEHNRRVVHVQKMTRQYLLSQYPPHPDPVDVLADKANGARNAKAYWTKALARLKARGVIDAATERRLAGEPAKLPRIGWGKAWLYEVLDGRPPEGYQAEFLSLAERAETHAKKARRRRRKPKSGA